MTLTDSEIAAIRDSFRAIAADPDAAGAEFYARLFAAAPGLRPMFGDDIPAQGRKLMAVLGAVVAHIARLDALMPTVRSLAERHVGYGVVPGHYALVGEVLDATLAARIGPAYGAAVRAAWLKAYGAISAAMIGFAAEAPRAA